MRLTGNDVWEVGVKMGWASGSNNPRSNPIAARAETVAFLLNEIVSTRENWLSGIIESEDATRAGGEHTARESAAPL